MTTERCGHTVLDDGQEEPCERPATGWRWYQDVPHEDTLEPACDWHSNEGGRRLHEAETELEELRARERRQQQAPHAGGDDSPSTSDRHRVLFLNGPLDRRHADLARQPQRVVVETDADGEIARHEYVRVDDPDTDQPLGAYIYSGPAPALAPRDHNAGDGS